MQDTAVIPDSPSAVNSERPQPVSEVSSSVSQNLVSILIMFLLLLFSLPGFICLFSWCPFSSSCLRLKRWQHGRGDDDGSPWILSRVLQMDWSPSMPASQLSFGILPARASQRSPLHHSCMSPSSCLLGYSLQWKINPSGVSGERVHGRLFLKMLTMSLFYQYI